MIGMFHSGVAIAFVVLAIAVLALVAMRNASKPKQRPEKWEKAKIMKQLLALSERETSLAVKAPSVQLRPPASRQGMRPGNAYRKTAAKTTLPIRSKTR